MNKNSTTLASLFLASFLLCSSRLSAQYCNSNLYDNIACDDFIESFSTTGGSTNISNANNGCGPGSDNYHYYNGMMHTAQPTNVVNFSITNNPYFSENYKMWVDWNGDADFLDAGEEVYNGGNRGSGVTFTGTFTVPAAASVGLTRLRVRSGFGTLTGACDLASWGEAEDYDFFVAPSSADNAIPGKIVSPVKFCEGTYPVTVTIKNNGDNVINSLTIAWELDGVPQPVINYTTPIPVVTPVAGSNEATVVLGNVSFVAPNLSHTIRVTVTNPNGNTNTAATGTNVVDYTLGAGLNGTYTIGGTAPSFPTVVSAANYLNAFGMCGPVTMNIRPGLYTGRVTLGGVSGSSPTNRITFKSETGIASDVMVTDVTSGALGTEHVFRFDAMSDVTLKDFSISATGTSGTGATIRLMEEAYRDSIVGCIISAQSTGSTWNTYNILGSAINAEDLVIMNNTTNGGDYGIYLDAATWNGTWIENTLIEHNNILGAFAESIVLYELYRLNLNDNVVNTTAVGGNFMNVGHSGMSLGNCENVQIKRNKVKVTNGGYGLQTWGMYNGGTPGMVVNNEIAVGGGSNASGDALYDDGGYNINYYNNSVHMSATGTGNRAAYFGFTSDEDIRNNVFSNSGGGRSMFMSSPTESSITCDYNNLHSSGTSLIGSNSGNFDSLSAWRIASVYDKNSISYDPGFAGQFDLMPDPNNPASWSLNGRGVHIVNNDVDKGGNARVTDRKDGVPDIGAYEFVPAVVPPLAKAIPALPVNDGVQVFTFGGDTVARIHWDANVPVPNSISVRQYTGTAPKQFPVGNHMYFYTDVDALPVTSNLDAEIYYKDPWMGKIPVESTIKIAKKEPNATQWVAYNDVANTVSMTRNVLTGTAFTSVGHFTGIENDSLFSAFIKPASSTIFCTGGAVTLQANADPAYTYQWKLNKAPIPGATQSSYTATLAGSYSVDIMENNKLAQSMEVGVVLVAGPSSHFTLNGPKRICPNSSLVLNAATGTGITYQWIRNGADIPGANTATYTATVGGNYSLRVKNIGCTDISSPVTITQGPVSAYLGMDTLFCMQSPLVLDAQNEGADYLWSTGDTTQTITVVGKTGKYWVEVNAGPNCISSDTINVSISPMPSVVGISYIKNGNVYEFQPSGMQNVDNLLWLFGDGSVDTARNIKHAYNGGNYTLKLVVFNACGSDTVSIQLPLTISEVSGSSYLNLYPNPASTYVMLESDMAFNDVLIVNNIGQTVVRETLGKDVKKYKVDLLQLPAGNYLVKLATKDGVLLSKRFVITK